MIDAVNTDTHGGNNTTNTHAIGDEKEEKEKEGEGGEENTNSHTT